MLSLLSCLLVVLWLLFDDPTLVFRDLQQLHFRQRRPRYHRSRVLFPAFIASYRLLEKMEVWIIYFGLLCS
jgi:hypothetical protein